MMSGGASDRPGHEAGRGTGLTKRAVAGLFWTFSGTGVQVVAQLLVLVTLGRLLAPAEFGLFGAAAVLIPFSGIVSIGVGPAIIQRRELGPLHVRVAFTLSATLGFLLGALVWVGAPAIADFYRMQALEPVLRGIALLFPIDGLNTVAKALLTRQLRFRLLVSLEVGTYVLGYACVGILLAWHGYGVWALVLANLAQVTLRTVAMYAAASHSIRPSLDPSAGRDLLHFGVGHSLAQVGRVLSQQADAFVVGRWLGAAPLGIYGRAHSLMVMPAAVFGRVVNGVLFPVMAQVQNEPGRLAGAYERALAVVALLALPLSAFLLVVAPELIPVVLGPAWTEVVTPFRLLSLSLLFHMSSMIGDTLTKAAGAVYARALRQGAFAAMVLLGALVGQRWGVAGVAVAVAVAMGVNFLSMAQLSRSVTGLSWSRFARAHLPGGLLAALIGGAVAAVVQAGRALQLGDVPILVAASLTAAAAVYAAATRWSDRFLGPHGTWAFQRVGEFFRQGSKRLVQHRAADVGLAPAGKANPE